MASQRYRFNFPSLTSPTYYNLSYHLKRCNWQSTRFPALAHLSHRHFEFDDKVATTLEYKHRLSDFVNQYQLDIMPLTISFSDNDWPKIVNALEQNYLDNYWILKPSLLNNGQSIKIFETIAGVKRYLTRTDRLGGEHVLQQYIVNPHLLRDNRKYSIRQFVVLTNYAGAYLYREGYFNIALTPYTADISCLAAHLTNEHLTANVSNTLQIPCSEFDFFPAIHSQIKAILRDIFQSLNDRFPQELTASTPKIALFGFDFMMDAAGRLWLLEANHGPCFPVDEAHPLYHYVYNDFWQQLIHSFIYPIAQKCRIVESTDYFELIN